MVVLGVSCYRGLCSKKKASEPLKFSYLGSFSVRLGEFVPRGSLPIASRSTRRLTSCQTSTLAEIFPACITMLAKSNYHRLLPCLDQRQDLLGKTSVFELIGRLNISYHLTTFTYSNGTGDKFSLDQPLMSVCVAMGQLRLCTEQAETPKNCIYPLLSNPVHYRIPMVNRGDGSE